MSGGAGWITSAKKAVKVAAAARGLGYKVDQVGKSFGPCPGCGRIRRSSPTAEKDGRKDRRGACAILDDGWKCYTNGSEGCGASGSVVDLAAWALTGQPLKLDDPEQVEKVKAWCEGRLEKTQPGYTAKQRHTAVTQGGRPPTSTAADPNDERSPFAPVDGADEFGLVDHNALTASPPASRVPTTDGDDSPTTQYMTPAEVQEIWMQCLPVTLDDEVEAYCVRRGWDPHEISRQDAARALPPDFVHKSCSFGRTPWGESNHRLILRGWRIDGENPPPRDALLTGGLQARYVGVDKPANGKKALWARGYKCAGLIFALHPDVLRDGLQNVQLTICEGGPDWLTWVCRPSRQRGTIWGVNNGSFTAQFAALVPSGWNVVVRDHNDGPGDKYATKIADLLSFQDVYCWRRSQFIRKLYKDDNDALLAGLADPSAPGLRPDSLSDAEPVVLHGLQLLGQDEVQFAPECMGAAEGDKPPKPLKNMVENTKTLLDAYKIKVKYCRMRHCLRIIVPHFLPSREREFNSMLDLVESLALRHQLSNTNVMRHLSSIAEEFHPVADWIDALPWDGVPRLHDFFAKAFQLADSADPDFSYLLFERWLLSVAYAVLPDLNRPTFVPQGVLVLQGPQNARKSQFFQSLFPACAAWVMSGMAIDPDNKDSVEQAISFAITEVGELDGVTRKIDHAKLKNFMTKAADMLRSAYAKRAEIIPRRTIMAATVNPKEYLVDTTGNRRFWTIAVLLCNPEHGFNMQQVWAEIADKARAGAPYYLLAHEVTLLAQSNREFERQSPLTDVLWETWEPLTGVEKLNGPRVTCQEIMAKMPSFTSNIASIIDRQAIQRLLTESGCKHKTETHGIAVYAVRLRPRKNNDDSGGGYVSWNDK